MLHLLPSLGRKWASLLSKSTLTESLSTHGRFCSAFRTAPVQPTPQVMPSTVRTYSPGAAAGLAAFPEAAWGGAPVAGLGWGLSGLLLQPVRATPSARSNPGRNSARISR